MKGQSTVRAIFTWPVAVALVLAVVGIIMAAAGMAYALVPGILAALILYGCLFVRYPLGAYLLLLLIELTVDGRTAWPMWDLGSGVNRGQISLCELLWPATVPALVFHAWKAWLLQRLAERWRWLWAIFLWLAVSTLLPLLGIAAGLPWHFATPALQYLRWFSYGLWPVLFWLTGRGRQALTGVGAVFAAAIIGHGIYAAIQVGAAADVLPHSWLYLDRLYRAKHHAWFFYPRATGLLVNPNSYGQLAALVLLLFIARYLMRPDRQQSRSRVVPAVLLAAAGGLVASGSRSALLGFAAGLIVILICVGQQLAAGNRLVGRRLVRLGLLLAAAAVLAVGVDLGFNNGIITARFIRMLNVANLGAAADHNFAARIELWREAIRQQRLTYPWGTWAPPSYVLDNAIDSFYVFTLVQGTLVYSGLFVLFMGNLVAIGLKHYRQSGRDPVLGVQLMAAAAFIAGASLTLSPMLEPPIAVGLWAVTGLSIGGLMDD